MKTHYTLLVSFFALAITAIACKKKKDDPEPSGPNLVITFKFDSTQARLGNLGQPVTLPDTHAAQNPKFNYISAHYVELSPGAMTPLTQGEIIYNGPTTTAGGASAIDFDKEIKVKEGEVFLSIPLSSITPGTYEYIRVSLAYQNYDIIAFASGIKIKGTVASFVGTNTYVASYKIKDSTVAVNGNRAQGYWGFESIYSVSTGQAPGTTVPNPISATSPIPAGSCVVTGPFTQPLTITGAETEDKQIVLSLSINNSFEWIDDNDNGTWEPTEGEKVVDMGLRGLIPIVQ